MCANKFEKSNNGKLPTPNQIKEGLKKLGRIEMKKAMGYVEDQKLIQKALDELDETLDEIFDCAKDYVYNELKLDTPLKAGILTDGYGCEIEDENNEYVAYPGGISDPTSTIVAILTYICQQESYVYKQFNIACREMDESKTESLGPFASAMYNLFNGYCLGIQ